VSREKFTPAPWTLVGVTHDEYAGGLVADVIGSDGECKTACLNIDDANLIASSPRLYMALRELVKVILAEDEEGLAIHAPEIEAALDALAQARGEKQ